MYVSKSLDKADLQRNDFLQAHLDYVVSALRLEQKQLILSADGSLDDEDERHWLDIRLNYREGNLNILIGSADYDTNHNGFWASSSLSHLSIVEDVARDLLDELIESSYY